MTEPVSERLTAALADRYDIDRQLGEGGMATVYLADDLKHDRKVAIKVLRPELAAVIGGERFLAEIKTTANLQHPHILPLFDSGQADGFLYYVMPYVEERSLRELLERQHQLDVDEAVRITDGVANALHYAHERGIIHRDIKPANILLHAGEPVVADFGIALAISAAGGGRLTETGLSLGTPHYMSPEQASADRELTARSDIYSVTCVLYEMLTGDPPHTGPSAQSVLVRILTENPRPVTDVRASVPQHLQAAISKGLEKVPADRFKTAQELRDALHDRSFRYQPTRRPLAGTTAEPDPARPGGSEPASRPTDRRWTAIHAAVTGLLALSTVALLMSRGGAAEDDASDPVLSFVVADSGVPSFGRPTVADDGTIAWGDAGAVYLRRAGATGDSRIEFQDESQGRVAALSPDGRFLVHDGDEGASLIRIPVAADGSATTLATTSEGDFALPTWGSDGWIYASIVSPEGASVVRVPGVGGAVETLFDAGGGFVLDVLPLPGGRGLVFPLAPTAGSSARLVALEIGSGDTATVVDEGFGPRWSPTGHLLYADPTGRIMAVPFDAGDLRITGSAVPVLEDVAAIPNIVLPLSLSRTGTLVYHQGGYVGGVNNLGSWSFRLSAPDGRSEALRIEPTDHWDARLSPDGGEVAYVRDGGVWIFDLDLGTNRRLTTGGEEAHNPVWSPDGRRIVFRQSRDDHDGDVFVIDVAGADEAEWMGGTNAGDNPTDWLDDGTIVIGTDLPGGDILTLRLDGDTVPTPILYADWFERGSSVSPDERWIAYESEETGTRELYVRSWPELGQKTQISDGDLLATLSYPVWGPGGSSLYYAGREGRLIEAVLGTGEGLRVIERRPTELLVDENTFVQDIHPDGRILLASQNVGTASEEGPRRIVVVTNWLTELRRRLGEER